MVATTAPADAQPTPVDHNGRWTALDTGSTANLAGVSFSDPLTGHAVGAGGTILATTDGGKTWKTQAACTTGKSCNPGSDDRITADLTGVGFWDGTRGVAVGARGTIVSTKDGGRTWTTGLACDRPGPCQAGSAHRTVADLTAVSITASSHAYAVGRAGTMLASDDYGRTWRRLASCALDSQVGQPCADGDSVMDSPDLFGVTATSQSRVHAVGAAGTLFATTDGGRTTYRIGICIERCDPAIVPVEEQLKDVEQGIMRPPFQPPLIPTDFAAVAAPDPRHSLIYAAAPDGTIFTPAYRGASRWMPLFACATSDPCQSSSPDRVRADITAVAFPNELSGYAVGDGGTILSLTRSSASSDESAATTSPNHLAQWRPENSGTTNDLRAIAFPTADTGFAVGEAGTVVKLTRPAPGVQVDHVRPASGPTVGRTDVKIEGNGFTGATSVHFGPLPAIGYKVHSDTRITATAPARAAGVAHVNVITPRGPSRWAAAAQYTYTAPVGGAWQPATTCSSDCPGPAAVLSDGKVLAAGGPRRGAGSAAAGLYAPDTRTWSATGLLADPRTDHTVTALSDGGALVAGGYANVSVPGRIPDFSLRLHAEVYDSRTGKWADAGELTEPRRDHTASLLPNGTVLLTGGFAAVALPGAEIWDPGSRSFRPTGSMEAGRVRHTATRLGDGTVLVIGGCSPACSSPLSSAESYDPMSQRWRTVAAPMKAARAVHTATLLANGEVLVVGGVAEGEKALASAERFDPRKGEWRGAAPMHVPRAMHTATTLRDGRVLVAGGVTHDPTRDEGGDLNGDLVASAEIYDPETDRWALVAEMPAPRALDTAVLLGTACGRDCGKVLLVAGTQSLEPLLLYRPAEAQARDSDIEIGAGRLLLLGAVLISVLGSVGLARRARRR